MRPLADPARTNTDATTASIARRHRAHQLDLRRRRPIRQLDRRHVRPALAQLRNERPARRRDAPVGRKVEHRQIEDLRVARRPSAAPGSSSSLSSVIERSLTASATAWFLRVPTHVGHRVEIHHLVAVQPGARLRAQDPLDRARRPAPPESRPPSPPRRIAANAAPSSGECRMTSLPASTARTAASPAL